MQLILFDNRIAYEQLQPFTYTRPISELRIGLLTIREKWEKLTSASIFYLTAAHLQAKYPGASTFEHKISLFANACVLPSLIFLEFLENLPLNTCLVQNGHLLGAKLSPEFAQNAAQNLPFLETLPAQPYPNPVDKVSHIWDIFLLNKKALVSDFHVLTKDKISQPISASNRIIGDASQIFLEEGAWVECATLNVQDAPIYVGKNAQIQEGAMVRGGLGLGEEAVIKMGAKIYGATSIGAHSKVGGEVSNSVIMGYSNKGHDGFLGNSVLGYWCNLGADTNNSNLKNNYGEVDVWDYHKKAYTNTGLQFCGLFMGDHSKCGINTMFNTGTVVGVGVNFYGAGFPPKYLPNFYWGDTQKAQVYQWEKFLETAQRVLERRHLELDATETTLLAHIYQNS
jgi:UDP-N-acetylglucosamine diphosphorylase/glucosamine-1-phosphate N-acetyltransferase